jgi:hypothetical protein
MVNNNLANAQPAPIAIKASTTYSDYVNASWVRIKSAVYSGAQDAGLAVMVQIVG